MGLHNVAENVQLEQFSQDTRIDELTQKLQENLTDP
jgi:hypothetical protein